MIEVKQLYTDIELKRCPIIGAVLKIPKNTQEKCACGELGMYKISLVFNYNRARDKIVWSCEEHKKDLPTLMCGSIQEVDND